MTDIVSDTARRALEAATHVEYIPDLDWALVTFSAQDYELPPRLRLVSIYGFDWVLAFTEPVPASERGTLLMDAEDAIRKAGFRDAVVWHEPLGDRSSLRNLRGIEVRS